MSKRLRSLDLNLVPVLRALLAEKSVTRAATRIGLSQPATSNALGRLRNLLGDALLVKAGHTMVRTPFAEHLLPLLEATCNELERLLHHEVWSAATIKRQFVVVMAEYLATAIAKDLVATLTEKAPNVTVRFGSIGSATQAELIGGKIDVAYVGKSDAFGKNLNANIVLSSPLQGVVPPTHPFATRPPQTLEAFLAAPRIGIHIPSHLVGEDQTLAARLFRSEHMPLQFCTHQLSSLPRLAAAMGAMAVVPATLASIERSERGMVVVPVPEREVYYHLSEYWSERFNTDPGHHWIRGIIGNLIAALVSESPAHRRQATQMMAGHRD